MFGRIICTYTFCLWYRYLNDYFNVNSWDGYDNHILCLWVFNSDQGVFMSPIYCITACYMHSCMFLCLLLWLREKRSSFTRYSKCNSRNITESWRISMLYLLSEYCSGRAGGCATMFIETYFSWYMYQRLD